MYRDDFCNPCAPHSTPVQDFPIRDNCAPPRGGEGMGCNAGCAGREAPPRQDRECTPVPPPVPPVRYVPGMNVQEQLCNMAERVNVSINRWNQIQANCYKALDEVVGAAVNNDVYYAPDEVRMMEGYDENSGCSYSIVEARAVDRAGRPIFCHLRPAYNNETNSGARELITDVSFVTSAQMVITGVQATETHWAGTSVFNGNPGNSAPDDTVWIAGWNRNGVLRFFRGDVGQDTLRQNRMVNCIGPVFPILKDGKPFEEVLGSIGAEPGSIQAMGWKPNGNKVFFNCGVYDMPGMTPEQVSTILQSMGCSTAVITSYQTKAVTAWDATPIAGIDNSVPEGGADVISVPGMTGGMTFLGRLTAAPIQWSIPQNCAAWVITKKPCKGWRNAFTTEVADVVQKLGNQENSMNSILGQLHGENEAISKLEYQVTQNTNDISEIKTTVGGFDGRITAVEEKLQIAENNIENLTTRLDTEIILRDQQYDELKLADTNERSERQAADAALSAKITTEESARKSADTVLQNAINAEASTRQAEDAKLKAEIDTEATTRANADRNLQAAIEAEASARSTKDTEHEARMDAIAAQEQKDVTAIMGEIDDIKDGTSLPIATKTKVGVVKIGKNLTVEPDGTLNAQASGGEGDTVVQGPGIKITENDQGEKVVSIDESVVVNEDELATETARIDSLEQAKVEQAAKDALQDGKIEALESKETAQDTSIANNTSQIGIIKGEITSITGDIAGIKDGSELPVASATTLGAVKVGANLSIGPDGTLSASGGEGGSGETVAQGTGISVDHNTETNIATVSIEAGTMAKINAVDGKADKSTVEALATTVAGKADKNVVDTIRTDVDQNSSNIANVTATVEQVQETANSAASGVASLNSNVAALSNTVNTNTQNIDANTTAISLANDEIDKVKGDLESVDSTATAAMDHATDAENAAASKVAKAGDEMTGNLKLTGAKLLLADADGNIIGELGSSDGVVTLNGQNATDVILRGIATPVLASDGASKGYVDSAVEPAITQAGQAASAAAEANSLATEAKTAADAAAGSVNGKVNKSGDTMTGPLILAGTSNLQFVDPNLPAMGAKINAESPAGIISLFVRDRAEVANPARIAFSKAGYGFSIRGGTTNSPLPIGVGKATHVLDAINIENYFKVYSGNIVEDGGTNQLTLKYREPMSGKTELLGVYGMISTSIPALGSKEIKYNLGVFNGDFLDMCLFVSANVGTTATLPAKIVFTQTQAFLLITNPFSTAKTITTIWGGQA